MNTFREEVERPGENYRKFRPVMVRSYPPEVGPETGETVSTNVAYVNFSVTKTDPAFSMTTKK